MHERRRKHARTAAKYDLMQELLVSGDLNASFLSKSRL
jgi:hypothetical protein